MPIIKSKRGELAAVRLLSNEIKEQIVPFLDVLPPNRFAKNPKSLAEQLTWVANQVSAAWGTHGALWVDTFDIGPAVAHRNQVAIEFLCRALRERSVPIIPVTGFEREPAHDEAIARLMSEDATGLCIRLEFEDLLLPTKLASRLDPRLKLFGLEPSNVDLVLDLRFLEPGSVTNRISAVMRAIQNLPHLTSWRRLILAGSSMPNSLKDVCDRGAHAYLDRQECAIWSGIQSTSLERLPSFADYTIVPPQFSEMNTRAIAKHLGPNVKYTLKGRWFVSRGESFQKIGSDQYFGIAKDVVGLREFRGPKASHGEKFISDRANGESSKCGNPEQWVTASVNSHITWQTRYLAQG
jgi:hypothetical protein